MKKLIRIIKENKIFEPFLFLINSILLITDRLAKVGSRKIVNNTLLIVRVDKLGDYVMFRNFIYDLKNNNNYKNYKFTLIGNVAIKNFVLSFDNLLFDNFIWIDIYKFTSNLVYRFKIARKIYLSGFEVTICPTYSRVLVLDDFIANVADSNVRICQESNLNNQKNWERKWGDKYYTKIYDVSNKIIFEYLRNQYFINLLINNTEHKTELKLTSTENTLLKIPTNFLVFVPGAGDNYRQWSPQNFSLLAKNITNNLDVEIWLLGAPNEKKIGDEICKFAQNDLIKNQIGILNFKDLVYVIQHSKMIISNETATVHIGAALDKPVFCISNGNHFGRWTEYPDELNKNITYVYPPQIKERLNEKNALATEYLLKSELDINTITVEEVSKNVLTILGNE